MLPWLARTLGDDELGVAFLLRNGPVDAAMCDPPDSGVEGDGPLDVPVDEVLGRGLVSEPVLRLDAEELPELSAPVLSAWATPDPLARAAPTPRVSAPAPSQL